MFIFAVTLLILELWAITGALIFANNWIHRHPKKWWQVLIGGLFIWGLLILGEFE